MATMKEVSAVVKVLQEKNPKMELKKACEVACDVIDAAEEARTK
jgi:hypothetical protein